MNGDLYVVWGIGPRDTNTNFAFKHFERLTNNTRITFNRNAANNCPAQTCSAGEVCPWAEEVIDARNRDATFVARIGQSGATRGYFGITGKCVCVCVCVCVVCDVCVCVCVCVYVCVCVRISD